MNIILLSKILHVVCAVSQLTYISYEVLGSLAVLDAVLEVLGPLGLRSVLDVPRSGLRSELVLVVGLECSDDFPVTSISVQQAVDRSL